MGDKGREYGVNTGRRRRCGWFDAVLVRHAVRTSGITGLALTKLDILDGFPEVKICTGYRLDGAVIDRLPASQAAQDRVEPIYQTFEGWDGTTAGARSWADLPAQASEICAVYRGTGRRARVAPLDEPRTRRYDSGAESLPGLKRPGLGANGADAAGVSRSDTAGQQRASPSEPRGARVDARKFEWSERRMAEYFPLLDRAVSGLPDQTSEARRSIYDRARAALIGQLRGMQPPIDEENIQRENHALDEAIARIEARYAATIEAKRIEPQRSGRRGARVERDRDRPHRNGLGSRCRPDQPVAAPAADVRAPGLPTGLAPPVVPPPTRDRPALRAARPPLAAAPVGIDPGSRNAAVRPVMGLRPVPPSKTEPVADRVADKAQDLDETQGVPQVGVVSVPDRAGADFGKALDKAGRENPDEASSSLRPRDGGLRPQAPRPAQPRRFGPAAIAVAAVIVVLMAGHRRRGLAVPRQTGPDGGGAGANAGIVGRAARQDRRPGQSADRSCSGVGRRSCGGRGNPSGAGRI